MQSDLSDTRVEIADTSDRDNYNKVVIHKRKCVPYATQHNVIKMGSLSGDGCKMQYLMHNNNAVRPVVPPKPRPKIPPKPQKYQPANLDLISEQENGSNYLNVTPKPAPSSRPPTVVSKCDKNGNSNGHLTERLIQETRSIVEENLRKERKQLLERMQSKVDLLKEDQHEIVNELTENSAEIENIVEKVRNEGNLADADKLKLHIDELESVTSLITVLKVRLKTTENKLEVTKDSKEKEFNNNKIIKLSSQLEEAEELRCFRDRRGDILFRTLASYLSSEIPELKSLLNQRVSLRSELCEVEEKLHLAVRQIEALKI